MLEKPCEGISPKTVLRLLSAERENNQNLSEGYQLRKVVVNIYNGLLNRIFYGSTTFLEETEEKLLGGVESPFYRFLVDVESDVSIFTLSSVPYDIMKLWMKDELDTFSISQYNLDKPAILFIHGFTAGSCFWVNNFDSLYYLGHPIFSIDLPGFGHSSRFVFSPDSLETENQFIDFIKLWQETLKISKLILIGHSMGGFLTYSYAIKYTEKLDQIILVDAWGFPDVKRKLTETLSYDSSGAINNQITKGGVIRCISYFLAPFSPYTFLRLLGKRIGPKFVGAYRQDLAERYTNLYGENATIFNDYIYSINSFYPTGEAAFRNMAQMFGWAKNPMVLRAKLISPDISISFIHGSRSWVSSEWSLKIKSELQNKVRVYILPDSGHHVYTDHPRIFNHILKAIILRIEEAEADRLESEVSNASTAESCFPIMDNFEKLFHPSEVSIQEPQ